jgi:hypothetical protein
MVQLEAAAKPGRARAMIALMAVMKRFMVILLSM